MTDKRLTAVVISTEQQLIINSVKLNNPEWIWQLIPEEATRNPATLMQSVFTFQFRQVRGGVHLHLQADVKAYLEQAVFVTTF